MNNNKILLVDFLPYLFYINILGPFFFQFDLALVQLVLMSFSTVSILIIAFFLEHSIESVLFKLLVVMMFVFGLVNRNVNYYLPNLVVEFSSLGILISPLVLKYISIGKVKNILFLTFFISVLYFISAIGKIDPNLMLQDVARYEAFDSVENDGSFHGRFLYFGMQLISSYLIIFLLLLPLLNQYIKRRNFYIILAISVIIISTYSLFFQKRQPMLELMLVLLIYATLYRKVLAKYITKNIFLNVMFYSLLIFSVYYSDIFSNVFNRIANTTNDIESFDRLTELTIAFSEFEIIDWIFGKGLGFIPLNSIGGLILHIGYGNILMKGGVIFLLFYLINLIYNILYCGFYLKANNLFIIGISFSIFSFIQMFYAPGYSWYFGSIVTGLGMFSRYLIKPIDFNI